MQHTPRISKLIRELDPLLWIHGHTHHNVDYRIGPTRVLTNQRGYAPDDVAPAFDESFAIRL